MTRRRLAGSGLVLSLLLAVTACSSAPRESSGPFEPSDPQVASLDASEPVAFYFGGSVVTTDGLDYDVMAKRANRMDTVADAAEVMGMPVDIIRGAGGAEVRSVWATKQGIVPQTLVVEYDNGVRVDITAFESDADARAFADPGVNDAQMGPHVKQVDIGSQRMAWAVEKLNVPAVFDSQGRPQAGTGVRRGTAKVSWSEGEYAVLVMSVEQPVRVLTPIAAQVRFTPLGK